MYSVRHNVLTFAVGSWLLAGACAGSDGHRSAVVAEVGSARVLHAESANRPLPPASLTKLMTVYLLLEALAEGSLTTTTRFEASANATAQPPSRFGFRRGEQIDIATLLGALVVVSANDAAVIAAEGLAGSEASFVTRMNDTARALGMGHTRFYNASGLPADGQRSTAADMAILANALLTRFGDQRALFARREVTFKGRRRNTINSFLGSYQGADGMKTGFTCRAGFNLVASVRRNGRHLIGVVMGASSRGQRAASMRRLMDQALAADSLGKARVTLAEIGQAQGQGTQLPLPSDLRADSCLHPERARREPSRWSIDIGVEREAGRALKRARRFLRKRRRALGGGRAMIIPRFTGVHFYRAVVTDLSQEDARDACLAYRAEGGDCVIMDTPVAKAQLEHARRVARLNDSAARTPKGRRN